MNPLFYIDFYKAGHVEQYHPNVTQVFSNWTPRSSRVPDQKTVVFFGLQYVMLKYLTEEFNCNFFGRPKQEVVDEYRTVIKNCLGIENPKVDHIETLHEIGYLPLQIFALPEGSSVNLNVPMFVVTNTDPRMFWLPNFLETLFSNTLWMPCTSATTAQNYRKLFVKHALRSGETDLSFVDWQGHDFSMRGLSGIESSILSGMGHLLSFSGTDTVPAIVSAQKYYDASPTVGGSVPATEHSVMQSCLQDGEYELFKRLITEIYPTGVVSIVSDTWDLWTVLTDYIPRLRDTILARNGKVVIRPDSGDPVKILVGNPDFYGTNHQYNCSVHPAYKGTLRLLADAMGVDSKRMGLPMIRNAGAIYGDSITPDRADQVLTHCIDDLKLSPYNCVFGIGSYTYQHVTRDTYNFCIKATAVRMGIDGDIVPIFKKPITDSGGKFSHKGIPAVYGESGKYTVKQEASVHDLEHCAFRKVYEDGRVLILDSFDTIRERVRS